MRLNFDLSKRKHPLLKNEIDNLIHIIRERYTCYSDDYTKQLIEALRELKKRSYPKSVRKTKEARN